MLFNQSRLDRYKVEIVEVVICFYLIEFIQVSLSNESCPGIEEQFHF